MVFQPIPDRSRWEGLIFCLWIVLLDLLMLIWSYRRPVDWIKFGLIILVVLSIPPLVYWVYRTWAAFTLEYWVDRNAMVLRWANVRQIIPLTSITRIILDGANDGQEPTGLHWPAPHLRVGRTEGAAPLYMAASVPMRRCVVVETEAGRFALSPTRASAFVDTVQARHEMGPAQEQRLEIRRTAYRERLFGANWIGPGLIGAGLLGVLVLVGVLMVNFPSLPDVLGFQYNSDGIPIVIRSKSALFLLPVIGFLTWFVNTLSGIWMSSRRQPTGAYMLWSGTLVVQVCSLLAMISIIP